ncbi:GNAT family N-acetyltransferase, partial [Crossiella equi]|uniref:GNAT family N-acetyltransferase n=1 Tax=Crossiella equi TaxID=130796 RepID=UPI001B803AE0
CSPYRVAASPRSCRTVAVASPRPATCSATRYGLHTLRAATAERNTASQRVLVKAGFVRVGPVDPAHLGGKPGTWYQCDLVRPEH